MTSQRGVAPGEGEQVVARGTKMMGLAQAANQVTRFIMNVALARLLVPSDLGAVAAGLVIQLVLEQLRDSGTGLALIQRRQINDELINAVFFFNVLAGFVLAGIVAGTSHWLADLMGVPKASGVLLGYAGIAMISSVSQIHHALLRRHVRFREIAIAATAGSVVTMAVSVTLAFAGYGVWSVVIGSAAGFGIDAILVWRFDKWRPHLRVHFSAMAELVGYCVDLLRYSLLNLTFAQADKVMVGRWLGAADLGVYSVVQRILFYPVVSIGGVLNEVVFPVFANKQDDVQSLRSAYKRSAGLLALIVCPLMAVVAVLARPLVSVLLGPKWHAAIELIWILAPIGAVQAIGAGGAQVMLVTGATRRLFRWTMASSTIVVASYAVGLIWGLVGICTAYAIVMVILTPIGLKVAFHVIELPLLDFARTLVPQLVGSLFAAACVGAFSFSVTDYLPDFVILVIGALIGLIIYVGTLATLRASALADLKLAMAILRGPRSRHRHKKSRR
jgi:lipopolysaccharide exporter